jgi:asparagine synthase (glutamine-hydrolysing)
MQSLIDQHRYHEIVSFMYNWSQWPGRGYRNSFLILMHVLTPGFLRGLAYKMMGRTTPNWLNVEFLGKQGVRMNPPSKRTSPRDAKGRRLVGALRDSLTGNGLASLLRHGDRNSMRWSIENRVPFLTVEMAEFLLSLPESYLLGYNGETKLIFRAAMRGIVPDQIIDRRDKIGFQTPEKDWLRGQKDAIQNWISETMHLPFLNEAACKKEVNQLLSGQKMFTPQAWRLINFCRWAHLQD